MLKYGGAVVVGLSLLAVSRGLTASVPPPAPQIAVDAAKALASPPPADTAPAAQPLAAAPSETPRPIEVSPDRLRRLVADEAAHPSPLRPEVTCMARAIYREAANQALSGQLAVAQVILNRVKTGAFGANVCEVVDRHGQFSQAPLGLPSVGSRPWAAAVAIAIIAEENRFPQIAPGALFFHAASMRPAWSGERERVAQIGDHIFYR